MENRMKTKKTNVRFAQIFFIVVTLLVVIESTGDTSPEKESNPADVELLQKLIDKRPANAMEEQESSLTENSGEDLQSIMVVGWMWDEKDTSERTNSVTLFRAITRRIIDGSVSPEFTGVHFGTEIEKRYILQKSNDHNNLPPLGSLKETNPPLPVWELMEVVRQKLAISVLLKRCPEKSIKQIEGRCGVDSDWVHFQVTGWKCENPPDAKDEDVTLIRTIIKTPPLHTLFTSTSTIEAHTFHIAKIKSQDSPIESSTTKFSSAARRRLELKLQNPDVASFCRWLMNDILAQLNDETHNALEQNPEVLGQKGSTANAGSGTRTDTGAVKTVKVVNGVQGNLNQQQDATIQRDWKTTVEHFVLITKFLFYCPPNFSNSKKESYSMPSVDGFWREITIEAWKCLIKEGQSTTLADLLRTTTQTIPDDGNTKDTQRHITVSIEAKLGKNDVISTFDDYYDAHEPYKGHKPPPLPNGHDIKKVKEGVKKSAKNDLPEPAVTDLDILKPKTAKIVEQTRCPEDAASVQISSFRKTGDDWVCVKVEGEQCAVQNGSQFVTVLVTTTEFSTAIGNGMVSKKFFRTTVVQRNQEKYHHLWERAAKTEEYEKDERKDVNETQLAPALTRRLLRVLNHINDYMTKPPSAQTSSKKIIWIKAEQYRLDESVEMEGTMWTKPGSPNMEIIKFRKTTRWMTKDELTMKKHEVYTKYLIDNDIQIFVPQQATDAVSVKELSERPPEAELLKDDTQLMDDVRNKLMLEIILPKCKAKVKDERRGGTVEWVLNEFNLMNAIEKWDCPNLEPDTHVVCTETTENILMKKSNPNPQAIAECTVTRANRSVTYTDNYKREAKAANDGTTISKEISERIIKNYKKDRRVYGWTVPSDKHNPNLRKTISVVASSWTKNDKQIVPIHLLFITEVVSKMTGNSVQSSESKEVHLLWIDGKIHIITKKSPAVMEPTGEELPKKIKFEKSLPELLELKFMFENIFQKFKKNENSKLDVKKVETELGLLIEEQTWKCGPEIEYASGVCTQTTPISMTSDSIKSRTKMNIVCKVVAANATSSTYMDPFEKAYDGIDERDADRAKKRKTYLEGMRKAEVVTRKMQAPMLVQIDNSNVRKVMRVSGWMWFDAEHLVSSGKTIYFRYTEFDIRIYDDSPEKGNSRKVSILWKNDQDLIMYKSESVAAPAQNDRKYQESKQTPWELIKDMNNKLMLRVYLQQCPKPDGAVKFQGTTTDQWECHGKVYGVQCDVVFKKTVVTPVNSKSMATKTMVENKYEVTVTEADIVTGTFGDIILEEDWTMTDAAVFHAAMTAKNNAHTRVLRCEMSAAKIHQGKDQYNVVEVKGSVWGKGGKQNSEKIFELKKGALVVNKKSGAFKTISVHEETILSVGEREIVVRDEPNANLRQLSALPTQTKTEQEVINEVKERLLCMSYLCPQPNKATPVIQPDGSAVVKWKCKPRTEKNGRTFAVGGITVITSSSMSSDKKKIKQEIVIKYECKITGPKDGDEIKYDGIFEEKSFESPDRAQNHTGLETDNRRDGVGDQGANERKTGAGDARGKNISNDVQNPKTPQNPKKTDNSKEQKSSSSRRGRNIPPNQQSPRGSDVDSSKPHVSQIEKLTGEEKNPTPENTSGKGGNTKSKAKGWWRSIIASIRKSWLGRFWNKITGKAGKGEKQSAEKDKDNEKEKKVKGN